MVKKVIVVRKEKAVHVTYENNEANALSGYWTNCFSWGRATRMEYWFATFIYWLVGVFLTFTSVELSSVWTLVTIVPGFTLCARRLHDTNRSNWNTMWFLLPIIGWIILLCYMCEDSDKHVNRFGIPRKS